MRQREAKRQTKLQAIHIRRNQTAFYGPRSLYKTYIAMPKGTVVNASSGLVTVMVTSLMVLMTTL